MKSFKQYLNEDEDKKKIPEEAVLRKIMVAELETVNDYEKMLKSCKTPKVIATIKEIIQEEKVHAHECQELLNTLDPNYVKAKDEAKSELSEK